VDADRGALQSNGHLLCLERAIGERQEIDSALWETGAFQAQVYPDLPIASSWIQLATKLFAGGSTTGSMTIRQRDGLIVRTVGAQCRSRVEIQKIMRDACIGDENTGPAGALLLVSGSHPARQLPLASCFLQSSFTMLLDAQKMRERGEIPSNLALWAVENPMISPPGRLQSKIDAGAEVILTQPPFTRTTAERWFQAISDSGAGSAVKIIAGVPMVSSLSNLEFWIRLCGFSHRPEAAEVRRSFPSPQQYSSKQELEAAIHQWNADFVQWVSFCRWPDVHVVFSCNIFLLNVAADFISSCVLLPLCFVCHADAWPSLRSRPSRNASYKSREEYDDAVFAR